MWFGILFAILVEIVPLRVRSTTVGVFLFVMNNIGGNLPIAVEPVSKAIGYRESLYIFYAGFYGLSKLQCNTKNDVLFNFLSTTGSIMFLCTVFLMEGPPPTATQKDTGHDNRVFSTADETAGLPTLTNIANGKSTTPRLAFESSRL